MKNIDLFKLPIAHRGITSLKRKILPNTLESCKLAIEKKTPIEIDVRITKDKDLILMHGLYILLENHELKHYKELEKNDINNKYISDSKCKIPRLEDVLKVIDGSIPILIDIKCESFFSVRKMELKLKNILSTYSGECFIQSFWPLFKISNNIKNGIIIPSLPYMSSIILKLFKYDFISFNCNNLNMNMTIKLKKIGKPILLWNYDDRRHSFYKKYLNANIIIDMVE